jgi:hypothetical protein
VLTVTRAQPCAPGGVELSPAFVGPPDGWTGSGAPTEGVVLIPDHIDPTNPRRIYDLAYRAECKYLYEVVLVDGTGIDINRFIARTILVELWDHLYLPRAVRKAWAPTIDPLRPAEHQKSTAATTHPAGTPVTAETSPPQREVLTGPGTAGSTT